jgi:hypothetical protein
VASESISAGGWATGRNGIVIMVGRLAMLSGAKFAGQKPLTAKCAKDSQRPRRKAKAKSGHYPGVVAQFHEEASRTRHYCAAKDATHRAACPDRSLRKERLLKMTGKLHCLRLASD